MFKKIQSLRNHWHVLCELRDGDGVRCMLAGVVIKHVARFTLSKIVCVYLNLHFNSRDFLKYSVRWLIIITIIIILPHK